MMTIGDTIRRLCSGYPLTEEQVLNACDKLSITTQDDVLLYTDVLIDYAKALQRHAPLIDAPYARWIDIHTQTAMDYPSQMAVNALAWSSKSKPYAVTSEENALNLVKFAMKSGNDVRAKIVYHTLFELNKYVKLNTLIYPLTFVFCEATESLEYNRLGRFNHAYKVLCDHVESRVVVRTGAVESDSIRKAAVLCMHWMYLPFALGQSMLRGQVSSNLLHYTTMIYK